MHDFLHQNVNQWLCIMLVALMCFWTVLYYVSNKAEAFGESIINNSGVLNN